MTHCWTIIFCCGADHNYTLYLYSWCPTSFNEGLLKKKCNFRFFWYFFKLKCSRTRNVMLIVLGLTMIFFLSCAYHEPNGLPLKGHRSDGRMQCRAVITSLCIVDDQVLLYISDFSVSILELLRTIQEYGSISGYKINYIKVQAIILGSKK